MSTTHLEDASSQLRDDSLQLRTDVYDALAAAKGYTTVVGQARWHGIARSTMFRLRAGGRAELSTAARIAADLAVPIEVVWGPRVTQRRPRRGRAA